MNRSNPTFDVDAFLIAFEDREYILDSYLAGLPSSITSAKMPVSSWEQLRDHLDMCPGEERRSILSGFQEAFELCHDEGHERLLQAWQLNAKTVAKDILLLPRECLALRTLTEDRSIFEAALSMTAMTVNDGLELFKPQRPVVLAADVSTAVGHFRSTMAALCDNKYGSRRILLKHFREGTTLTVGFYFEKAPKAQRVLQGSDTAPNLKRDEYRPVQMDFVIFDELTGILSVKSSYGRNTDEIRRAFGDAFLADAEAYFWPGARDILELKYLFNLADTAIDDAGAVITDVNYGGVEDQLNAKYNIHSNNVRAVLRRDGLDERIRTAHFAKAVVKIPVAGKRRGRRVVLQHPNKIEFRRTSTTADILQHLKDFHVFNAPIVAQEAA